MNKIDIKPWEMGEEVKTTGIPALARTEQLLVKLAPPKGKTVRDGLVSTFITLSYINDNGDKIDTIVTTESESGYNITFPLGKRGLIATKYRGPKNYYRFLNLDTKKFYTIPQEKFTVSYAEQYLGETIMDWKDLPDSDKDQLIDEYLEDMFLYGLSQDLSLPIEDEEFTIPKVGTKTEMYRVYEAPKEGEKWGRTIITKWQKGQPNLDGTYTELPEALATAVYDAYLETEDKEAKFDPTDFVEDDVV